MTWIALNDKRPPFNTVVRAKTYDGRTVLALNEWLPDKWRFTFAGILTGMGGFRRKIGWREVVDQAGHTEPMDIAPTHWSVA